MKRPSLAGASMRRPLRAVVALLAGLTAAPASAGEIQSLAGIRAAVQGFLEEQTAGTERAEVSVGRLDSRLRLADCPSPLQTSLPTGSRLPGRVTVLVRCEGPKPWTLYVQGKVEVFEEVLVAARPLARGRLLAAGDLKRDSRPVSRLSSGYFTDGQALVGMKVKRPIRSGMPIGRHMVEARKVVRRGERVMILAESGGVTVRMAGKALTDGAKGDLIRVENLSSKRTVEAVVASPGRVRVRM